VSVCETAQNARRLDEFCPLSKKLMQESKREFIPELKTSTQEFFSQLLSFICVNHKSVVVL